MKPIIIKPIITEKSLALAAKGWFTFATAEASNKGQISQAVDDRYNVNVVDARTMIMHGKKRRDWKKALVMLKEGQKIDAFEIHEQKS